MIIPLVRLLQVPARSPETLLCSSSPCRPPNLGSSRSSSASVQVGFSAEQRFEQPGGSGSARRRLITPALPAEKSPNTSALTQQHVVLYSSAENTERTTSLCSRAALKSFSVRTVIPSSPPSFPVSGCVSSHTLPGSGNEPCE